MGRVVTHRLLFKTIKTYSYDKTHSIHHAYTHSLMAYGLLRV